MNYIVPLYLSVSIAVSACGQSGSDAEADASLADAPIQTINLEGRVQKGPFTIGSTISVAELTQDLAPTGLIFQSEIEDNTGSFVLTDLTLASSFVRLQASGFYFNEVRGILSTAPIELNALAEVTDQSSINVNLITHIEKRRVEFLIAQGETFASAKNTAFNEILSVFEISIPTIANAEDLDFTVAGDDNAALLAISAILVGNNSTAELVELVTNISLDMEMDGTLDDPQLGTDLLNTARGLNVHIIRRNIERRYDDLSVQVAIGDFERHIARFITTSSFQSTANYHFPPTSSTARNNLLDRNPFGQTQHTIDDLLSLVVHMPTVAIPAVKLPTEGLLPGRWRLPCLRTAQER